MIVYHVTSFKKINKYARNGVILPPVRAWETIEDAERFSKQTGRPIILRLKFPENAEKLGGHRSVARVSDDPYDVTCMFGNPQSSLGSVKK